MSRDWLRDVHEQVLPREGREGNLEVFDGLSNKPLPVRIKYAAGQNWHSYRTQMFTGINLGASIAAVVLVTFCLVAASGLALPSAILFTDGVVLAALMLRGTWAHRLTKSEAEPPNYYLDSTMDAMAAMVTLLFAQCLAPAFSAALVLPGGLLAKIAVICLPLIATFQLALRPMPGPETPESWNLLSAVEMYRNTKRLNFIWGFLYSATILMNTSDIPNYTPDKLRGFVPIALLVLWFCSKVNNAFRRIKTMFGLGLKDRRKEELQRLLDSIPRSLQRGENGYWLMQTFAGLLIAVMSVSQGEVIWRWFAGHGGPMGTLVLITNMMGLILTVVTLRYVKQANIAAAKAVRREIAALTRGEGSVA